MNTRIYLVTKTFILFWLEKFQMKFGHAIENFSSLKHVEHSISPIPFHRYCTHFTQSSTAEVNLILELLLYISQRKLRLLLEPKANIFIMAVGKIINCCTRQTIAMIVNFNLNLNVVGAKQVSSILYWAMYGEKHEQEIHPCGGHYYSIDNLMAEQWTKFRWRNDKSRKKYSLEKFLCLETSTKTVLRQDLYDFWLYSVWIMGALKLFVQINITDLEFICIAFATCKYNHDSYTYSYICEFKNIADAYT